LAVSFKQAKILLSLYTAKLCVKNSGAASCIGQLATIFRLFMEYYFE
jgi:hypothetical protein